jgi:hypothetical protein
MNDQSGSVLVTSLIAVAVLFILFLSAFSYGIARYSVHVKSQYKLKSRYLAETGINRVLHMLNSDTSDYHSIIRDSLYMPVDGFGNIKISARPFGAYLLLTSEAESGNQHTVARALIGKHPGQISDYAVALTDHTYPLTVTGNTRIIGDIFSGMQPLATGLIDGQGAYYDTFHIGNQIMADEVPAISTTPDIIMDYKDYISREIIPSGKRVSTSLVLNGGDEDYLDEYPVVVVEGNLEINGLAYTGKNSIVTILVQGSTAIKGNSRLDGLIEIISDRHAVVEDSAIILGGVYSAGDSLVLKDNCYFRAQGISAGNIVVEGNARVDNPSLLLAMAEDSDDEGQNVIDIESRNRVSTICMLMSPDSLKSEFPHRIYIDSTAIMEGHIFSSGYTDLRGTLYGSVITRFLYYYHAPTTYINWLRNVFIDRSRLAGCRIFPMTLTTEADYGVFSVEYH